jgi:hypothetical protein
VFTPGCLSLRTISSSHSRFGTLVDTRFSNRLSLGLSISVGRVPFLRYPTLIDVSLFLWVYPDVDLDRSSSCSFFYLVRGSVKHIMGSYSHYGLAFLFGRRAVGRKGARAERRLVCSGSHRLAKAKNYT